jgi:hypothetical protein
LKFWWEISVCALVSPISIAYFEAFEFSGVGFPRDLYVGHSGSGWSPSAEFDQFFDGFFFPFENGFNSAIREVSHPAGDVMPDGFVSGF